VFLGAKVCVFHEKWVNRVVLGGVLKRGVFTCFLSLFRWDCDMRKMSRFGGVFEVFLRCF